MRPAAGSVPDDPQTEAQPAMGAASGTPSRSPTGPRGRATTSRIPYLMHAPARRTADPPMAGSIPHRTWTRPRPAMTDPTSRCPVQQAPERSLSVSTVIRTVTATTRRKHTQPIGSRQNRPAHRRSPHGRHHQRREPQPARRDRRGGRSGSCQVRGFREGRLIDPRRRPRATGPRATARSRARPCAPENGTPVPGAAAMGRGTVVRSRFRVERVAPSGRSSPSVEGREAGVRGRGGAMYCVHGIYVTGHTNCYQCVHGRP
jgi:hypothetical protein